MGQEEKRSKVDDLPLPKAIKEVVRPWYCFFCEPRTFFGNPWNPNGNMHMALK
jgi:hypothetical protein